MQVRRIPSAREVPGTARAGPVGARTRAIGPRMPPRCRERWPGATSGAGGSPLGSAARRGRCGRGCTARGGGAPAVPVTGSSRCGSHAPTRAAARRRRRSPAVHGRHAHHGRPGQLPWPLVLPQREQFANHARGSDLVMDPVGTTTLFGPEVLVRSPVTDLSNSKPPLGHATRPAFDHFNGQLPAGGAAQEPGGGDAAARVPPPPSRERSQRWRATRGGTHGGLARRRARNRVPL